MARVLAALAALLVLGACSTAAQREAQAISSAVQQTQQKAGPCFEEARAPTRARLPNAADPNSPDIRLLNLDTYVTDDEADALVEAHNAVAPCHQAVIAGYQAAPPLAVAYMNAASEVAAIKADLVSRKITWGEANRRIIAASNAFSAEATRIQQTVMGNLNAAHYREADYRQRASVAAQQYLYQQQLLSSYRQPNYTNCNQFGSMVNCTTY